MNGDRTISIKAARVDRGMTQEALAQKLGVTKRTVIAWENEEVAVKPLTMYAIAYVLDMDADFLRVPVKKFTNESHLKCRSREVG